MENHLRLINSTETLYETNFKDLQSKYNRTFMIVSPPRCSSTAVARMFWEFSEVSYYSHEPYESYYYEHTPLENVFYKLQHPIDICDINEKTEPSLTIKEMSFQVEDQFPFFVKLTKDPILFIIRNPLLSIMSRIDKKIEGGFNTSFPLKETGWESIYSEIQIVDKLGIKYNILDATDFREYPDLIAQHLCAIYGLNYTKEILEWQTKNNISLDNLGGKHDYLYTRVLSSTGVIPPIEKIPKLEDFPSDKKLREHIKDSIDIYELLLQNRNRIRS